MKLSGRFVGYSPSLLRRDIIAGIVVGIVAIPLGMAFAIAAGVRPEYGIYTTVIAGFLISLFGGSKYQIGGPTGAFVPVLFAVVMQYGYENLLIAGLLAGVLLVLMGLLKLGTLIQFIPRPVTVGFTAGIAVLIFSGQLANFLGLRDITKHERFLSNMKEIGLHLSTTNALSVVTSVICLATLLLSPKLIRKVPGSLIGLVVSSVIAVLLFDGEVATIGSTYGAIPSGLPHLNWPELSWAAVIPLIQPAIVIAMLGGIESLLSAVVADGMTGSRHHSNRELIGQGIANIVTPLFGGIPATGAIARTATNIKNGAASPVSGMVHSVVVLLVLLALAPYAANIPLAAMAPILMVVAWNMSERKEFIHIAKARTSDSLVLIVTFLLTVLVDLTTAVEVGLGLAVLFFLKQMIDGTTVANTLPGLSANTAFQSPVISERVQELTPFVIHRIEGVLFFGTAAQLEKSMMEKLQHRPKLLLLVMDKVIFIDSTGESSLSKIVRYMNQQGGSVLIAGIQAQPQQALRRSGLDVEIGPKHFFDHPNEALDYAMTRL